MCSSSVVLAAISKRCAGQFLPWRSNSLRPCYSLLKIYSCKYNENNRWVHTTKSNNEQVREQDYRPQKLQFAVVTHAFPFTRSLSSKTMDGTVLIVDENNITFEFGKYIWHCKRPFESRIYYSEKQHVRGSKIYIGPDQPLPKAVVVITSEFDKTSEELNHPQFPYKLTGLEKSLGTFLVGVVVACVGIVLVLLFIILVCSMFFFDAGLPFIMQPIREVKPLPNNRPKPDE